MVVYSYTRGNKEIYDEKSKKWKWSDGSEDEIKPCVNCSNYPIDDVDYCLRKLKDCKCISNACCGHNTTKGYIMLEDGRFFVLTDDFNEN